MAEVEGRRGATDLVCLVSVWVMAGNFAAIATSDPLWRAAVTISHKCSASFPSNANPPFVNPALSSPPCHFPRSGGKMAGGAASGGLEDVEGPTPKLQKVLHHSSNGTSDDAAPVFRVKRLSEKAVVPSRASPLSAGYDLSSAADTKVPARGKALVPTDLSISIPQGSYARIAPRSGLAWKHSIDVGAGVIDADYRGPVGVVLFSHSDVDFEVKAGDRIAQLIVQVILTPEVVEVEDLDSTARGAGGFGSTGV